MPWKDTRTIALERCYCERAKTAFHRRLPAELLLHQRAGRAVRDLQKNSAQLDQPI